MPLLFCHLLVYCALSDVLFTVEIEHSDCPFGKKNLERNRQDKELTRKKINIYSKAKAVWNSHTPNLLPTLKLYFLFQGRL